MAAEFRRYPAPPPGEPATPGGPDPRTDPGFYQIVQGGEVVAAYDSAHYPSLQAVLGDLMARRRSGDAPGTPGEDYGIWRAGRQVGAIRAWRRPVNREAPDPDVPKATPLPPGEGESPGRIRIADAIRDDYRAA